MTANFENTETAITMWLAFCSNNERSPDAWVDRTREVISLGSAEAMAEWVGKELHTVYLNRGRDEVFLQRLFAEDSPALAMGCVKAALDARLQGDDIDIDRYFAEYTARYGERPALLAARLRWLVLYINYPKNTNEVERIMALLASGEAA